MLLKYSDLQCAKRDVHPARQMSRQLISQYATSALRYVRQNAGKITVLSLAVGGVIAASHYLQTRNSAAEKMVQAERAAGAKKLRSSYVANCHTVSKAFRALLPLLIERISRCEAACCEAEVAALRERPDKAQKRLLWMCIKTGSVSHVIGAAYLTSVLYVLLSLQMNLVARYRQAMTDESVQSLPGGGLSEDTSKRFLGVAEGLLNGDRIGRVMKLVSSAVDVGLRDVGLTVAMGCDDAKVMLQKVMENVAGEDSKVSVVVEEWLREAALEAGEDENLKWLLHESLDLCESLNVRGVVRQGARLCLDVAVTRLRDDMHGKVPFAHLLGRFQKIGRGLGDDVVADRIEAEEEVGWLAASVFLSGERASGRGRDMDGTAPSEWRSIASNDRNE